MSILIQTSPKHCANQGFSLKRLFNKKLICILSTSISTLLFIILILYLTLHPSKPQFYLKDATISNLTSLPRNNSSIQVTFLSKNPNTRVSIYYNNLRAYALYKGRQITEESNIPSFYQGNEDTSLLLASLHGTEIPIEAKMEGGLALDVKVDGELKWKIGSWISGNYGLGVHCVAIVNRRDSSVQGTQCSTSV